jgi:hypothetical protein
MSATSALAAAPAEIQSEPVKADAGQTATQVVSSTSEPAAVATTIEVHPAIPNEPAANEPVKPAEIVTTANDRQQAVARIRQSALPPALRERLAAVVEAGQSPNLDVAACLEAIEQTLPDFLRTNRENVSQPTHPVGNAFFQGGDSELSDAEAEALAARQLARSGLLRGQRVKVAD